MESARVQLDPNGSVFVVGAGKAGVGTAGAAAEILGNQTELRTWPAHRRHDPLSLLVCRPERRRVGSRPESGPALPPKSKGSVHVQLAPRLGRRAAMLAQG